MCVVGFLGTSPTPGVFAANIAQHPTSTAASVPNLSELLTRPTVDWGKLPNGCSNPAPGFGYLNGRFTAACNTHDYCYNGYFSSRWNLALKIACDLSFLRAMQGVCGWNLACRAGALAYYVAVRDYGYYAWYNSDRVH